MAVWMLVDLGILSELLDSRKRSSGFRISAIIFSSLGRNSVGGLALTLDFCILVAVAVLGDSTAVVPASSTTADNKCSECGSVAVAICPFNFASGVFNDLCDGLTRVTACGVGTYNDCLSSAVFTVILRIVAGSSKS